ncbi:peptidylprolyl isomerase [Salinivirga cyanobacteriivorans]
MKKIIILLLVLAALTACNNEKNKGEFPPYKISKTSADSIVETITYKEYLKEKRKIDRYNKLLLKDQYKAEEKEKNEIKAFTNLIKKKKINHELDYLGIQISKEEQDNYMFGNNIHPGIKQNPVFRNPKTGKFNPASVQPFIKKLEEEKDSDPYFMWTYQINNINKNLRQEKYESLLKSSFFITEVYSDWLTNLLDKEVAIKAITLPYSDYNDSVTPTNEDFKTFLEKNKNTYQINERRYLRAAYIPPRIHKHFHEKEYKSFKRLIESGQSFEKIASMSPHIKRYSSFYYKNTIPQKTQAFFEKGKPGDVFGPYFTKNSFRSIKIESITYLPEKAWAHHLLLRNSSFDEANKVKEQFEKEIKKGEKFLDIAKRYSKEKPNKAEWGDTEWFMHAEMEKDFSDSTFYNQPGEIVLANTRFGWHIIKIFDHDAERKRYNFTGLYQPLSPTEKDIEATMEEARSFAENIENPEEFDSKAVANNYILENYEAMALDTKIRDLNNSQHLYNWAFNSKKHAISNPYKINGKIYVFKIEAIGEPGTMPLHAAKNLIEPFVIKEKAKAYVKQKYNENRWDTYQLLTEAIERLNMNEYNITGIKFSQNSLANVGGETEMIGLALALSKGERTKLIFGKEHLYSIEKTGEKPTGSQERFFDNKKRIWKTIISNGRYRSIFNLYDRLTVNKVREQDSYFLLPKYADTLPNKPELNAEMYPAEKAFREQKYDLALKGSKSIKGFQQLAHETPSKQSRLAAIYGGICALHLQEYQLAVQLLSSVKTEDRFFSIISLGAQGDALSQQGKLNEALNKYKAAIKDSNNFIITPHYILKIAAIYASLEEYDKAISHLKLIKEDYKQAPQRREAEKLYGFLKYKTQKNEIIKN